MNRFAVSCIAFAASAFVGCASAPKAASDGADAGLPDSIESASIPESFINYVQAWLQTNRLVAAKKFDEVYPRVSDLMSSSLFDALPSEERHRWVFDAASLGRAAKDFKHSQGLFVSASEMPEAGLEDWDGRYIAALSLHDSDDAVYAITTIARRWPESLGDYTNVYIRRLALGVGDTQASEERRMRLLEVLYANNWKLDYGAEPSGLWREYVRMLMERGNTQKALEVSRRITDPRDVLALRVDNRFEQLVRAEPTRLEVGAAIERTIAEWQAITPRFPMKMEPAIELAYRYMDSGRFAEALSLTNQVIARVAGASNPKELYEDLDDKINWIHDTRANALEKLGRWSEAEPERRQAAGLPENGHPNVSSAINLAFFYVKFGRTKEALEALGPRLSTGTGVSSYGAMQVRYVLHAVAVTRKDSKAARESLDYMRAHQSDALSTFQEALLVANNLNEAASLLTQRLENPQLRGEMLAEVQEYQEPALSPLEKQVRDGWRLLRKRPDVRAAVARVGKIERFPLPPE